MTIFLLILKIIGILLLVVLGLLVLLLVCPLRYRLAGEKNAETARAEADVRWLWGAFRVQARLWPEPEAAVWIFGRELGKKAPPEPPEESEEPALQAAEAPPREEPEEKPEPGPEPEPEPEPRPEPRQRVFREAPPKEAKHPGEVRRVAWEEEPEPEEKPTEPQRPPVGKEYFLTMPREEQKALLKTALALVKRLLKIVAPRDYGIEGVVGADDPCTTGYILAGCGVLTALCGSRLNIRGDFEEARLEGSAWAAGRVRLGAFGGLAIWGLRQKPLRQLLKDFLADRKQTKNED